MKRLLWLLCLVLPGLVQPLANAANEEYPHRARYPDVPLMTTEELGKRFGAVLVVDVRSKYEFDTLHVKDAVNVPLTSNFGEKMVQLRAKNNKPFVFYCNGKTCHKSYDAALLAAKARLDNLYAYDAGIFDWAKAQPEKTVLLGRSPIVPENLIDESSFKARLIEPKDFVRASATRVWCWMCAIACSATRRSFHSRNSARSLAMAETIATLPVLIYDHERILGWQGKKPRTENISIEQHAHWMIEELDIIPTRTYDPFEIDE